MAKRPSAGGDRRRYRPRVRTGLLHQHALVRYQRRTARAGEGAQCVSPPTRRRCGRCRPRACSPALRASGGNGWRRNTHSGLAHPLLGSGGACPALVPVGDHPSEQRQARLVAPAARIAIALDGAHHLPEAADHGEQQVQRGQPHDEALHGVDPTPRRSCGAGVGAGFAGVDAPGRRTGMELQATSYPMSPASVQTGVTAHPSPLSGP